LNRVGEKLVILLIERIETYFKKKNKSLEKGFNLEFDVEKV